MRPSTEIPTALLRRAERLDTPHGEKPGQVATGLPGLTLYRANAPTGHEADLYPAAACLVLQGRKDVSCGKRQLTCGAGDCIIVSHDLAVIARIAEARPAAPYLALILELDLAILRSLASEIDAPKPNATAACAMAATAADPSLVDAFARYLCAAEDAAEREVVGPLILKELHFRLLRHRGGQMLRALTRRDSQASRITRAISAIRARYREPMSVAVLASDVGMSVSSFHQHFKAVTARTPLEYLKELRLTEARHLLSDRGLSVASAAYEVGYESPTQFSREFSRRFGTTPGAVARNARSDDTMVV